MADHSGPIHVSPAVIEVLRQTGFPPDNLEAAGFPALARLLRRAMKEAGHQPIADPLDTVERAPDHAASREGVAARLVR